MHLSHFLLPTLPFLILLTTSLVSASQLLKRNEPSPFNYNGPQAAAGNSKRQPLMRRSRASSSASPPDYVAEAESAITVLTNEWYNTTSGLWDTTGWWNAANILTMLAELTALDATVAPLTTQVFRNTFTNAQLNIQLGNIFGQYVLAHSFPFAGAPLLNPHGFVGSYYDDMGWWALAWVRIWDVTHQPQYLEAAVQIFQTMVTGWGGSCSGVWWDTAHSQKNAITNELFFTVAANLALRSSTIPEKRHYRYWALASWEWFVQSGLVNAKGTINDGLFPGNCSNNGGIVWTYNQGVLLGGLVALSELEGNETYLSLAKGFADAAIANLTDSKGILHDPCEPTCNQDQTQFKGIFVRNLRYLYEAAPVAAYKTLIETNAQSVWTQDRSNDTFGPTFGPQWSGPFAGANASTHSSACDVLVAAVAIR